MSGDFVEREIEVRACSVGPWPMNSYALVSRTSGESFLVDPGADPDVLEKMLEGTRPRAILLTHTHGDHVGALEEMRRRLGVPVWAHRGPHLLPVDKERSLMHGDVIGLGSATIRVHHTPGHIADQIAFEVVNEPSIIVGDTIFEGGPGKTWSQEGFQTMLSTLRSVVLQWPDACICFPGHGPSFQLGPLRSSIETFAAKDHGEFFGDATWEM